MCRDEFGIGVHVLCFPKAKERVAVCQADFRRQTAPSQAVSISNFAPDFALGTFGLNRDATSRMKPRRISSKRG